MTDLGNRGTGEQGPSPAEARLSLQISSRKFLRDVWSRWISLPPKDQQLEKGIVVRAANDVLKLGAVVAHDLDITPEQACRASLEVQTGRSEERRTSLKSLISGYVHHVGQNHSVAANWRKELEPGDPRIFMTTFEIEASRLLASSTNDVSAMISELVGEEAGRPLSVTERYAVVLGNHFNAIGYTALMNFNSDMGDNLQVQ